MIAAIIREMADAGVKPAGRNEPGWYWLCSDGRKYWVTDL